MKPNQAKPTWERIALANTIERNRRRINSFLHYLTALSAPVPKKKPYGCSVATIDFQNCTTLQHFREVDFHFCTTLHDFREVDFHFCTTLQHFREVDFHFCTTLQHFWVFDWQIFRFWAFLSIARAADISVDSKSCGQQNTFGNWGSSSPPAARPPPEALGRLLGGSGEVLGGETKQENSSEPRKILFLPPSLPPLYI